MNNQYLTFIESSFWIFLTVFLLIAVATFKIMLMQQKNFYTMGRVRQRFSILDLQFTSTPEELPRLLQGIDGLADVGEAKRSKVALRTHLYVGFIFMAAFYPLIFLLCCKTGMKMDAFGQQLFMVLAFAQLIPFVSDIIENIYLLLKLSRPRVASITVHRAYQGVVIAKWTVAGIGITASISALLYFWLRGEYDPQSLIYLLISGAVAGAIAILSGKITNRSKARPQQTLN